MAERLNNMHIDQHRCNRYANKTCKVISNGVSLPSYSILFLLMFTLVFVTACGRDSRDKRLNDYIKTVKTRAPAPVEPVPQIKPLSKYTYPSAKRRSPFKPFEAKRDTRKIAGPDLDREKQPLEAFPMDSLRMVGILREGNKIWGIISAPDGTAYRVTIGSYMGKNFGRVVAVMNKEIKLIETVRIAGRWEKRPLIVSLHAEE